MENLIENNKLIAEFMGAIKLGKNDKKGEKELHTPDGMIITCFHESEIRYSESWDWLMPVLEKIEGLSHKAGRHFYLFMEQGSVQMKVDRMNVTLFSKWGTSSNSDKFNAIYRAIVEFIEWYNIKK